MKKPKVIVIGLDGATWDLIKPWADEGKLPAFKKLMEKGAWGKLESTTPAVTFPAWEVLFTGVNPGKLGVYGFVQVDVCKNKFKTNTPNSFRSKPVWNILSDYGYKSCVINVPTAKVHKINGVIIGGPFSSSKNFTYPHQYTSVLDKIGYQIYPLELSNLSLQAGDEPSIKIIEQCIASRFELAKSLIKKEEPDFLALTIFAIDNIQHHYWGRDITYQSWKIIDKELNLFLNDCINSNSFVIMVSDHGFAKILKTFYISKFLENLHLIKYKKSIKYKIFSKIINIYQITNIIKKTKTSKLIRYVHPKKILANLIFQDDGGRLSPKGLEEVIDWSKSKAIPIDTLIYLNCQENQRKTLKKFIKQELEKLDILEKVYCKEEIYTGKYIESAPDLVILPKKGVDVLENPFVSKIITKSSGRPHWNAIHETNGIFLITGPNIIPTKNIKTSILDIAPTILHLFGIPSYSEMDGRILKDIIGGAITSSDSVTYNEKLRIKRKIRALRDKL